MPVTSVSGRKARSGENSVLVRRYFAAPLTAGQLSVTPSQPGVTVTTGWAGRAHPAVVVRCVPAISCRLKAS
ncbi:MAG: hypothetical protein MUF27_12850 [Acidobacteria bacterium]|nr:hypothetical protein [Acidobacteriota bacterium]